ncbi:AraC family transcriptional regulator (plasmid) [Pseudomonas veronii 1YdBTEX2]|uniref:AraC family transcriptional regulator n=1 Tax=Pseudomonas veronii 1YdBTEX2 TaxID=1295141 RepID=A0A1D3KAH5_PSEVE|nr:AraC family transcriptional regulator [Pseudomonas veronii 1YdBTEX2]
MVHAGFVAQAVNLMEGEGLDSAVLLQRAGIDKSVLQQAGSFVPLADAFRLMALVVEVSGNPGIGLRAYRHYLPGGLQLLGHVMMSSANLQQAMQSVVQYLPLLGSGFVAGLSEEADGLRFWFAGIAEYTQVRPRSVEDMLMASILGFCRWLTGNHLPQLREVEFTYPQPADTAEHQRLFACDLKFGASRSSILFDRQRLLQPLSSSNEALALLLGDFARYQMERLRGTTCSARVRALLLERLSQGPCDMETVARWMNVSKRTLQRGLIEEGTNFKSVLDEVRQQLASYYLRHRTYNLFRISELLGFKESSSFHKACLRWYGMPPGRYRAQLFDEQLCAASRELVSEM